jgi:hypothetical protein
VRAQEEERGLVGCDARLERAQAVGEAKVEMAMGTRDPIPDGYLLHLGMYVG